VERCEFRDGFFFNSASQAFWNGKNLKPGQYSNGHGVSGYRYDNGHKFEPSVIFTAWQLSGIPVMPLKQEHLTGLWTPDD